MLNKLMTGRLGNQMFQYAAIRAYQIKYNISDPINLNFYLVRKDGNAKDGFYNQLDYFKLNENILYDKKMHLNLYQYFLLGTYFVTYKFLKLVTFKEEKYLIKKTRFENKIQSYFNKHGLFVYSYGYCNFKKSKTKNSLFIGFYESNKYFDDIKETLKLEFTPKEKPLAKNKELYKIINNTKSICVSIRRGDFLAANYKDKHYICTPKYFQKAIDIMQNKVNNAQFIIFSDDIKWVKENMKFPKGTLYESGSDPVWEKLRLMYSCKHFILSNSTFSWWAQYLSDNKNKIVIAPSKWINGGVNPDIYDKNWILINPDELKKDGVV